MGAWTSKCKVCNVRMPHHRGRKSPWTGSFTCYDCSTRVAAEQRAEVAPTAARTAGQSLRLPSGGGFSGGRDEIQQEWTFVATGDDVWTAVLRYAEGHELREANLSRGEITFTTKMSLTSPGEKYVVAVGGADGEITVSVTGQRKNTFYALQPGRIRKIASEVFAAAGGVAEPPEAEGEPEDDDRPPWRR